MKNLTFAAIVMMVMAVLGTSCTKTQTTPAEPGKAMVTLHLGVNTNETNDTTYSGAVQTQWENVPSGTVIQFVIDSKDLQENPDTTYSYDKLTSTGTVDASGNVTVELPAIGTPLNAEVKFPDLELDVKKERINAITGNKETYTESTIFTRQKEDISIWDGAMIIQEHNY